MCVSIGYGQCTPMASVPLGTSDKIASLFNRKHKSNSAAEQGVRQTPPCSAARLFASASCSNWRAFLPGTITQLAAATDRQSIWYGELEWRRIHCARRDDALECNEKKKKLDDNESARMRKLNAFGNLLLCYFYYLFLPIYMSMYTYVCIFKQ